MVIDRYSSIFFCDFLLNYTEILFFKWKIRKIIIKLTNTKTAICFILMYWTDVPAVFVLPIESVFAPLDDQFQVRFLAHGGGGGEEYPGNFWRGQLIRIGNGPGFDSLLSGAL